MNRDRNEDNLIDDKYMGRSVLMLRDQKWRNMRTTLSKMKYTFGLLTECSEDFISFHEEKAKANGGEIEIDTHDVFARVTADGISSTALGLKSDCIRNKDSEIFSIAEDMETDFSNPITAMMLAIAPKVFKLLGWQMF